MNGYDILSKENRPESLTIIEAFILTKPKLQKYKRIACSISGGSDSDILLDMLAKLDVEKKVRYVFFDTGIEYEATKRHIKNLCEKYGIEIERIKAKKTVPASCREFGLPFISKKVSGYMERLQRNGFQWESGTFIELLEKYCVEVTREEALDENGNIKKGIGEHKGRYFKGCCAALRWWCNEFGEGSQFNIAYNKWLKEFIMENPPKDIKFSDKCCMWAKKKPVHEFLKENGIELNIYGVRKAEGGQRATAYKNCFSENVKGSGIDEYRPLFWFKNNDKEEYERFYEVEHSDCYIKYGLKRTGCAGCPFGKDFEEELRTMSQNEPKLYKAVCNIFGKSYEYTRKYREYAKKREYEQRQKKKEGEYKQLSLFE